MPRGRKTTTTTTGARSQLQLLVELVLSVPPPSEDGFDNWVSPKQLEALHSRRRALLIEAFANEAAHGGRGSMPTMTLAELEEDIATALGAKPPHYNERDTPEKAAARAQAESTAARLVAHVFSFGGRMLRDLAPDAVRAQAAKAKPKAAEPATDRLEYAKAKPAKPAKPAKKRASRKAAATNEQPQLPGVTSSGKRSRKRTANGVSQAAAPAEG